MRFLRQVHSGYATYFAVAALAVAHAAIRLAIAAILDLEKRS